MLRYDQGFLGARTVNHRLDLHLSLCLRAASLDFALLAIFYASFFIGGCPACKPAKTVQYFNRPLLILHPQGIYYVDQSSDS